MVTGPYENNPRNPVLTHRHLGLHFPVVAAGHADLVQDANGGWWAVALAVRPRWADDGSHWTLGRETFLAQVCWEDGWPVINPGFGTLRDRQPVSALPAQPWPALPERDDFDRADLGPGWSFVRTPPAAVVSLTDRPGWLTLRPQPSGIADIGCPGFIGRPQSCWTFRAAGLLDFQPRTAGDVAGLVLRQNEDFSLQLLITGDDHGGRVALVIRRAGGLDSVQARRPVRDGPLVLSVAGRDLDYSFGVDGVQIATVDGRALSSRPAGGFTGTMLGPYVFSLDRDRGFGPDENDSSAPLARWDWFDYRDES